MKPASRTLFAGLKSRDIHDEAAAGLVGGGAASERPESARRGDRSDGGIVEAEATEENGTGEKKRKRSQEIAKVLRVRDQPRR